MNTQVVRKKFTSAGSSTRRPGDPVPQKRLLSLGGIALYSIDALQDVNQIEPIVLHSGTASSSTFLRTYQWSPSGSAIWTRQPRRSCRSMRSRPISRRLLPGSISTRRSRSLSSLSSPRATEPKTRTFLAP